MCSTRCHCPRPRTFLFFFGAHLLTFSMEVISWMAWRRSWMDLPLFLTQPTPHRAETILAEAITLGLYRENLNSETKESILISMSLVPAPWGENLFAMGRSKRKPITERHSERFGDSPKEITDNPYLFQVQLIHCNRLVSAKRRPYT